MKPPPIPPFTVANLVGAVGDVMRASAAWGMADARGEDAVMHVQLTAQAVAQLLTLALQREPTNEEMSAVIGG